MFHHVPIISTLLRITYNINQCTLGGEGRVCEGERRRGGGECRGDEMGDNLNSLSLSSFPTPLSLPPYPYPPPLSISPPGWGLGIENDYELNINWNWELNIEILSNYNQIYWDTTNHTPHTP